jgi:hypothetical protein
MVKICLWRSLIIFSAKVDFCRFCLFYPREHAMLARVYILLFVGVVVVVVVVVVDALLNYCEFRHGWTSSSLLRISSWLHVG